MPLARVEEVQFIDHGETAVLHVPTGRRYWILLQDGPGERSFEIKHSGDFDKGPNGEDYSPAEIAEVAVRLIRRKMP